MKRILLIGGIIVVVLMGVGCNSSSQTQVADQAECKHSTFKPVDNDMSLIFPPTDCEFQGFGKKIAINGLDTPSCKRISQYVIVDKNHVYKQFYDPGSSSLDDYIILNQVQRSTFTPLQFDYYKDASHIYYDGAKNFIVVKKVDLNSVQVLSTHVLKDKNNIYFVSPEESIKATPIPGFDVKTFEVIQNEENHEFYFKDKNGVYFIYDDLSPAKSKIQEADSNSFEVLNHYLMAKDKNHVYNKGKIVEGADSQTFEILSDGYFKDKNGVYTVVGGLHQLSGVDGCSFELINYDDNWRGYSKDKNHVYFQDEIVEDADPATFQVDGKRAFDKHYEFQGKFKKK